MKRKICINIGHGGLGKNYDSGAVSLDGKLQEHTYNRDKIVPVVVKALEKDYDVVTIIQEKSFSELPARINALKPDLILSFHLNASDGTGHGTETLYWSTSKRSLKLAKLVQGQLVKALGLKDRDIKPKVNGDRGAALLRDTNSPCVLIETGFIDHQSDMDTIESNLNKIGTAIKNALDGYYFRCCGGSTL